MSETNVLIRLFWLTAAAIALGVLIIQTDIRRENRCIAKNGVIVQGSDGVEMCIPKNLIIDINE